MAYTLTYSGGTINITNGTINSTQTSLTLPGRSYAGYGQPMDQNLVSMLENFAAYTSGPNNPIQGQLWYDSGNTVLKVNTSSTTTPNWGSLISSNSPNINLSNVTIGNLTVTNSSDLGNVGNVTITGGTNGQVLTTDGGGNLSWTTYTGVSGYSGVSGAGASGYSGWSGFSGAAGSGGTGTSGYSGISGFSGQDGAASSSGYSGVSGFSGAAGSSSTITTADNTTNATFYPVFVSGAGSGQNPYIRTSATAFTFNASTGDLTAPGNVTAYSDIKLKSDIQVIENALDKVKQIRGVTYIRNDLLLDKRHTGVIAQEVMEVLPEVVTENDGKLSVAYGNMIGLLIEAIKEQAREIDILKAKVS